MSLNLRRILVGKPLATHMLEDETLPKILALPIFSSDALSSVAYATQEMMIQLTLASAVAFSLCIWQAGAIVFLLLLLTASYNQTIYAYPQGGGAYNVSHDNLGVLPAQVAAVSLMTDYVLTVAVSVTAGVDAIISALLIFDPTLSNNLAVRLGLCMVATWFIVWMNLRGVRESGKVFALPVYFFIVSMLILIGVGLFELYVNPGHFVHRNTARLPSDLFKLNSLGLFLILRSFASGCTALTGLEAISNSTAAFRRPKSRNAGITMWWLAACLGSMLLGVTWLAQRLAVLQHIVPTADGETVISQVAHAVVGQNWFYWCVQISTFLVLVLAANTSFTGFPRLGAMVAADGFLPKQLMTLGDRLVYVNGIVILGMVASALELVFKGNTDRLIPLYAIGVYMAFTLSQAGMVVRHRRTKGRAWQFKLCMNGLGSIITLVVAVIFGIVKFTEGAWVVLILIPLATWLLHRIGQHYQYVRSRLNLSDYRPLMDTPRHFAIVPVHEMNEAVRGAIDYAQMIGARVEILQWTLEDAPPFAVEGAETVMDRTSANWRAAILKRIQDLRVEQRTLVTVVLAEDLPFKGWIRLLKRHTDLVIKLSLLNKRGVVVADTRRHRMAPGLSGAANGEHRHRIPHVALVLIPALHQGTMLGLEYARRISRNIQALNIELDLDYTPRLREAWEQMVPDIPLMVMESPYRELREPLIQYIRALRLHKPGCIITVVVPEFVAQKWWDKVLHNHAGFLLKLALRNESGIVLANPRYFLQDPAAAAPSPDAATLVQ